MELFPKDTAALESSYIHHWGPIYVAGKRFDLAQTASPRTFEILLGGAYRLESERPVRIDGRTYEPGESVFLPVGPHMISADPDAEELTLRWAAAGPAPERPAPTEPLFFGY